MFSLYQVVKVLLQLIPGIIQHGTLPLLHSGLVAILNHVYERIPEDTYAMNNS